MRWQPQDKGQWTLPFLFTVLFGGDIGSLNGGRLLVVPFKACTARITSDDLSFVCSIDISDQSRMATTSPSRPTQLSELHRQVAQLYASSLLNRAQLLLIIQDAGPDSPIGTQAIKATENETEIVDLLDKFRTLPVRTLMDPLIVGKELFLRGYFCELKGDIDGAKSWYRQAIAVDSQLEKSDRIQKCLGYRSARSSWASDISQQESTTVSPVQRPAATGSSHQQEAVTQPIERESGAHEVEADDGLISDPSTAVTSTNDPSEPRPEVKDEKATNDHPATYEEPNPVANSTEAEPVIPIVVNFTLEEEGNIRHSELFADLLAHTLVEGASPYRSDNFLTEMALSPTSQVLVNGTDAQRGTGIDVGFRVNNGPEGYKTFNDLYGRPRGQLATDDPITPSSGPTTDDNDGDGDDDDDDDGDTPMSAVRHEHPISTTRRPSLTVETGRRLSEGGILTDIPALEELPKALVSPIQTSPSHSIRARRRSWGSSSGVDITPTSPSSPSRLRQSCTVDDD